jgi:hypothetical protein
MAACLYVHAFPHVIFENVFKSKNIVKWTKEVIYILQMAFTFHVNHQNKAKICKNNLDCISPAV